MFRMLLNSSSRPGDCMCVYWSVMIDVYALAFVCLFDSVSLWVCWCGACYCNVSWMCSFVVCESYHVPVSVCTCVLVRFGWSRVVSECRLVHCRFVRVGCSAAVRYQIYSSLITFTSDHWFIPKCNVEQINITIRRL